MNAKSSLLVVSATNADESTFLKASLLARSLQELAHASSLRAKVQFNNREGLAKTFNSAIDEASPQDILVFCREDVGLDDAWLLERLEEALREFDVVGVAGCIKPKPAHSAWNTGFESSEGPQSVETGALSGRVRRPDGVRQVLRLYGPAPAEVQLLDGCFLAVRAETLLRSGLRFDERFDTHFCDLDFCREATRLGLRIGVWPITVTYGKPIEMHSDAWQAGLARYWSKWPIAQAVPVTQAQPVATITPELAMQFNAANAEFKTGNWSAALHGFELVLAGAPSFEPALLGRARCSVKLGEPAAAREAFAALLRENPTHYSAWLEAGHLCRQLGESQQALAAYGNAIESDDARFEAWLALTRTLEEIGETQRAAMALTEAQRAAARSGGNKLCQMWHLLGRYRLERGDLNQALAALRTALYLARTHSSPEARRDEGAEVCIDIAELLLRDNQTERAMPLFTEASASERESTLARLAETAFRYNLWQDAIAVNRRNLELHPESAWAHWNLAHLLAECWQMSEAEALLTKAERMAPMPGARTMRGQMAGRMGDADAALAHYQAHRLEHPKDSTIASSIAMCALYCDSLSAAEVATLTRELFAPLGLAARPRETFQRAPLLDHHGRPRRIRLGLVSADFHFQHPVNIFMQPVLRELDQTRFEVFMYYTGISSDEQTHQAKSRVSRWREATHLNDRQLAKQIDADAIDVLMDLSGHTGRNRMAMFAQRAAPVQVSYLGYPGSTGVPNMDWIIGDEVVTPAAHAALYSEQVARLPGTVFCFAPEIDYPFPSYTSEHAQRRLTFGSFNNVPKLTQHTLRLWARILLAVPEARLVLKAPSFGDPAAWTIFRERFAALGVSPERVEYRGPVGLSDMMAEYADIDIALDPLPYNGGTTTLQAMWMGVPVVVKEGGHFVSRMGASFMRAAGLADWVATSDDDYVAIAVARAKDRQALLTLKQNLRARQLRRVAWDVTAHTRALEEALLRMVRS